MAARYILRLTVAGIDDRHRVPVANGAVVVVAVGDVDRVRGRVDGQLGADARRRRTDLGGAQRPGTKARNRPVVPGYPDWRPRDREVPMCVRHSGRER